MKREMSTAQVCVVVAALLAAVASLFLQKPSTSFALFTAFMVLTVTLLALFGGLDGIIVFIKPRYIYVPPLSYADLASMWGPRPPVLPEPRPMPLPAKQWMLLNAADGTVIVKNMWAGRTQGYGPFDSVARAMITLDSANIRFGDVDFGHEFAAEYAPFF